MRLAEPDAAIKEERVEAGGGRRFGNAARAGIGEFVRLADHEGIESETLVERGCNLRACDRRGHRGGRCRHRRCGRLREVGRGVAAGLGADVHTADGRVLGLPERGDQIPILFFDPVPQKTGGQDDGDFIAINAGKRDLLEPGAIFDLSDLGLQTRAYAGPLLRQTSIVLIRGRRF